MVRGSIRFDEARSDLGSLSRSIEKGNPRNLIQAIFLVQAIENLSALPAVELSMAMARLAEGYHLKSEFEVSASEVRLSVLKPLYCRANRTYLGRRERRSGRRSLIDLSFAYGGRKSPTADVEYEVARTYHPFGSSLLREPIRRCLQERIPTSGFRHTRHQLHHGQHIGQICRSRR